LRILNQRRDFSIAIKSTNLGDFENRDRTKLNPEEEKVQSKSAREILPRYISSQT
jgi:hypothetical protein